MRSKAPAAALLMLCLGLTACSGGGKKEAAPVATSAAPVAATTAPAPSATPAASDPLTGTAPRSTGRVVGVKVDNAVLARPYQSGLGRAAIVYEELVEGGSTRLLAVYESDLAGSGEVGPIRSARESDIELVRQFGQLSLAFSGANTGVKAIVHAAARNGWLVDASYDVTPGSYRLGAQRRDARNFFAVPARLAAARPGSPVRDIGLRVGPLAPGGAPTAVTSATFGQTRVTVRYDAASHTWSVAQDGRLMPGVAPANIVIQRVVERGSRFVDVHGQPTPYTVTTGSGPATVLRDGTRIAATWKRDGYGPTRFRTTGNRDVALRPGRTWVLLVPTTGSVSFG
jgi:hypothetical protein